MKVDGHPASEAFTCEAPISAQVGPQGSRAIDANGLHSKTEFTVLRRNADGTALLEARPLTGRTNQIRLHLQFLGMPVCGDPLYGAEGDPGGLPTLSIDAPPLCLHAWQIRFRHPLTNESVEFTAPPPLWS